MTAGDYTMTKLEPLPKILIKTETGEVESTFRDLKPGDVFSKEGVAGWWKCESLPTLENGVYGVVADPLPEGQL